MIITEMKVKTVCWIKVSKEELDSCIENYWNTETLKLMYPKAQDSFNHSLPYRYDFNADAMSVLARYLGFDHWENSGYYKDEILTCAMRYDGDMLNK